MDKKFLLVILLSINLSKSENCGVENSTNDGNFPWMVSIFYSKSDIVLCQGTLISDRSILTAGHCLQHKELSNVVVYPGLLFYRPHNAKGILWQVEKINLHPDMKLTSVGKFINGGFVSSMKIRADIAVATLKQKIQFTDNDDNRSSSNISAACLPTDKSIETSELNGSFSGWNVKDKNVETFNASIVTDSREFYEVIQEKRDDNIAEGTGLFTQRDSHWTVIGLKTMNDFNSDGIESIQFVKISLYLDWITSAMLSNENRSKISNDSSEMTTISSQFPLTMSKMRNTTSTTMASNSDTLSDITKALDNDNISRMSSTELPAITKAASLSSTTTTMTTKTNLNESSSNKATSTSALLNAASSAEENSTSASSIESTSPSSYSYSTSSSPISTKSESSQTTSSALIKNLNSLSSAINDTLTKYPANLIKNASTSSFKDSTLSSTVVTEKTLSPFNITKNIDSPVTTPSNTQTFTNAETSTSAPAAASKETTLNIPLKTLTTNTQTTTTANSVDDKSFSTKPSAVSENISAPLNATQILNAFSPNATGAIKQGRNLKNFDNATMESMNSTINSVLQNSFANNSTDNDLQNATMSDVGEQQPLLASFNLPASALIGITFGVSILILFTIFGILSLGKPTTAVAH